MKRKKTVLIVVAHADDMEFFAAGTVARFTQELGYDVYEYILTDNGKGSYRLTEEEVIEVSAGEAKEAGEFLGLKEVWLEGYADGELNLENTSVLREKVMRKIREVKADIVMGWDPYAPYEDHPDHRACAFATLDAASFSANECFHREQKLEPYPVTEAYWFAKSPHNAECFVDITSTIEKKVQALLLHDCQMMLTLDALLIEAEALGVEVPLLEDAKTSGPNALIDMGIRQWNSETGKRAGFEYAEQFRYEKLSVLESYLGLNVVNPDFGQP